MSHDVPRAPRPLFDRLCAGAGEDCSPLDAAGLRVSLARDLSHLLNARSRLPLSRYVDEVASVIDWGLPDFSALSAQSGGDRQLLRQAVLQAIACFEPRLQHVHVEVDTWPDDPHRARLNIDAAVRIGRELRRVEFALPADGRTSEVS